MPSATYRYNSQDYNPAMPIMEVAISGLRRSDPTAHVVALVDSGADATMLPVDLLDQVKARFHETKGMRQGNRI